MRRKVLAVLVIFALSFIPSVVWAAAGDSADDPILIATAADLDNMRTRSNMYYKLSNDIDLTNYLSPENPGYNDGMGWLPIGVYNPSAARFSGELDGGGHKITGLWINRSADNYVGLFGYTLNITVENLIVEIAPAGINGRDHVGGLIGHANTSAVVENVRVYAPSFGVYGREYIGGLIGRQNGGSVINSHVTGNVASTGSYVGGLAGYHPISGRITIEGCSSTASISGGASYAGGLVGYQNGNGTSVIRDSYATGGVMANGNYVGGLVGCQYSSSNGSFTIARSYVTGNIRGATYVGGLVGSRTGYNYGSNTLDCYVTGNITSTGNYAGGLVGLMQPDGGSDNIINSYATGEVRGNNYTGGLVGCQYSSSSSSSRRSANSRVANSYATGDVSGGSYTGGLMGGLITYASYNSGDIISSIENCYSTGNVSGNETGGLVGYQYSRYTTLGSFIVNCYSTGKVDGGNIAGGLVGLQQDVSNGANSIEGSYNTGDVTGGLNIGAIVGQQSGASNDLKGNYRWDLVTLNGVAPPEDTPDGKNGGLVTANQLMTKTTYTGNKWLFNDSTPVIGPWHWDNRGFPKLNMGIENWPWPWEGGAPSITGPTYMELYVGYAATYSGLFTISGTAPVTVTKISGHANITWDDVNKRLNIAPGLPAGSYSVVLTASNAIGTSEPHTFTLAVIDDDDPPDDSRLYFTPENITAGLGKTFTITFNVNSPESYNRVECVLVYNPALVELEAVTQIPSPANWMLLSYTDFGTASFTLVPEIGSTAMLTGNNLIATLRFKALQETSGTDISIIQLQGYGAGSSKLQRLVGSEVVNIPFTTKDCTVAVADGVATLKASFQLRPMPSATNIENLMVKWISGNAVIAEETVTADQNGEAAIAIPPQNSGLTIWVKGERTLAVSQYVGTVSNGSVINIGTLLGGDANGDNMVDLNDFNIFLINYGRNRNSPGFNPLADFNNDGVVDLNDFNIFIINYGKTGVQLPAGYLPFTMSTMSAINEESEESTVNDSDSDSGCNAGIAGYAALALFAAPLFRKRQGACLGLKKIFRILLIVFSICAMSVAGYAAEHTMMISTDKDVYEVGEKFNVYVMATLTNDEALFSLSSVISFDQTAFSVDNIGLSVSQLLKPVGMLMLPLPLDSHQNLIGGTVSIINFASPDPVIIANTYLTFSAEFEAVTPGTYELVLPEDTSYPGVTTSFLVKRSSVGNPPPLLLVPSTKINKTITILPPK